MGRRQVAIMGAERALRDYAECSDEQLVARVLEGEAELFEVLMRRHNRRLFRLVRGVLRDDSDTVEVVHEAYIQAYNRLASLRQPDAFAAWAAQIAYRQALSRLQARHKMPLIAPHSEIADGEGRDPERLAAARELRLVLERAIDRLPDTSRVVFMLRDVEGMKTAAVAELLECSEEAVKVRLHRARRALRELVDEQLGVATREAFAFAGERCDRLVLRVLAELHRLRL